MVSVYRKDESLKRCRKPHPSFVKNHGMLQQLPFFFFLWVIMVLSNFSWFFCANLYKEKKERQDIGKDLGSEFTINLSLGCEILRYKWTIVWVWVFSFGSFFFYWIFCGRRFCFDKWIFCQHMVESIFCVEHQQKHQLCCGASGWSLTIF